MKFLSKSLLIAGVLLASSFSVFGADALKVKIKQAQERTFQKKGNNMFDLRDAHGKPLSLNAKKEKWAGLASEWNMTMDEVRTFVKKNSTYTMLGMDQKLLAALNAYLAFSTTILDGITEYFKLPETRVRKADFMNYLNDHGLGYEHENGLAVLEDIKTEKVGDKGKKTKSFAQESYYGFGGRQESKDVLLYLDGVLAEIIKKMHKDYNDDITRHPLQ